MSSIQKPLTDENKSEIGLIMNCLSEQLTTDAFMWLSRKMMRLKAQADSKQFKLIFKVIPQRLGTSKLNINETEKAMAKSYRQNWMPEYWQIDEAARIAVLLNISDNSTFFMSCVEKIVNQSKECELIALYKGLSLFPQSHQFISIATNAIQHERKAVIEALIHYNPFPHENFDKETWDEMISRAESLGIRLEPIMGMVDKK